MAQSTNYQLAEKLLDAAVIRQRAIAANVANAETPGFKRLDLAPDFAATLKAEFSGGRRPSLEILGNLKPTLREDPAARSIRADGNNVELETELMALSRNQVDYEFLTEMVSRHIKGLRMAITGRVL